MLEMLTRSVAIRMAKEDGHGTISGLRAFRLPGYHVVPQTMLWTAHLCDPDVGLAAVSQPPKASEQKRAKRFQADRTESDDCRGDVWPVDNGCTLALLPTRLRAIPELVLAAVAHDPRALLVVGAPLSCNFDFLYKAVSLIDPAIKETRDFRLWAGHGTPFLVPKPDGRNWYPAQNAGRWPGWPHGWNQRLGPHFKAARETLLARLPAEIVDIIIAYFDPRVKVAPDANGFGMHQGIYPRRPP